MSVKVVIKRENDPTMPMASTASGERVEVGLADLPVGFVFNQTETVAESAPPIIITERAEINEQTSGQHTLTTSNGYNNTDNFHDLLNNFRFQASTYGLSVNQKETGEWVFVNVSDQQIDIRIEAVSGGKKYTPIEQENTSIVIDGRNIRFSLKGGASW